MARGAVSDAAEVEARAAAWIESRWPGAQWRHVQGEGLERLPGFVELTSAPWTRHLIGPSGEVAREDRRGLLRWMRAVGIGAQVRPSAAILVDLLGHLGHLPRRCWPEPPLPREAWDRHFRCRDPEVRLEVEHHGAGFTLTLPFEVRDGGVLSGGGLPGAPPTSCRVIIDVELADPLDLPEGVRDPSNDDDEDDGGGREGAGSGRHRGGTGDGGDRVSDVSDGVFSVTEEVLIGEPSTGRWAPVRLGGPVTQAPARAPDRRPAPEPWSGPGEHLEAWLDRVRLLLCRYVVRYWYRLTDLSGNLDDALISLQEMRMSLTPALSSVADTEHGLPALEDIEGALDALSRQMAARTEAGEVAGGRLPVAELQARFGLSDLELDLVMVAVAGQLSEDLGRAMRFCWSDYTRKAPTLLFLAEVVAADAAERAEALSAGESGGPLVGLGLVALQDPPDWRQDAPEAMCWVRVSARISAFIQGRPSGLESEGGVERDGLGDFCTFDEPFDEPEVSGEEIAAMVRALRYAHRRVVDAGSSARALCEVAQVVALIGPDAGVHADLLRSCPIPSRGVLTIDVRSSVGSESPRGDRAASFARRVVQGLREAVLLSATPLVVLGDGLGEEGAGLLAALRGALRRARGVVILSATRMTAGLRALLGPCPELDVKLPDPAARLRHWGRALAGASPSEVEASELVDLSHRFALSRAAIVDVVRRARVGADVKVGAGAALRIGDLQQAIRIRIENNLGTLAEPFSTPLTWEDLILADDLKARLSEMVAYASNERTVHDQWGFGRLNTYGRGLTALFGGPPGTGKTMAAAIIARELGYELYRVDLSRLVDKYVGETEKNLARVFDEAERSRAVLLFDEADSLFGKRSSGTTANDRYANLEVNYLLQRMEHFNGTSILTTNLAGNIDEAFQRRIRFRLTFRLPDQDQRERLWRLMLPDAAPVADDIDFARLARDFEMAPAHIKNAALRAAFQAARGQGLIDNDILRQSAVIESRELGNLVRG